ncbi:MAG: peptidoglycan-binding protein [Pseudomonadales bacterium]|nr:peptidoglycan-binding protein [Pseudomonadales bacterium]
MRNLTLIICLLLAQATSAADKNGSFAVRSSGMMTCKDFVTAKSSRSDKLNLYMGWLDGYISAANQFTKDTFDIVRWGNTVFLITLIENHCKSHPDQRFYLAANQLVAALLQQRITERTELVEASYAGNSTYLYEIVLRELQTKLQQAGLLSDEPNGQFTKATRIALEAYQAANSLQTTGLPDQLTLYKIFAGIGKKPES